MPGMDGVQFISRVAERGLASAVVIASGLDSKVVAAVKAIGESHGIQLLGAVEKPLTARRVTELLASYRRPPGGATSGAEVSMTAAEVASALAEGRITTVFAPVVDLTECRVSGAEAAGRLAHPTKGQVVPDAFVPVLGAGGVLPYVEAVLEEACALLRRCAAVGLRIGIGLDLPPAVLGDATLADRLAEVVHRAGVDPAQVTCEVAAHVLSDAPPAALDVMTRLRVKNFGLALDRFGTRRPPTARLAHIPCTLVKIDGSLVGGAASGPQRELLEETLDAAQSLDIPVLADGCESEADFDLAVELGFRYAQGGFLGGPVTAARLLELAGSWKPPGAGGPEAL
jgi:EAL domain-containing protein (putative c-di-GMP-specific phosphodiesterase class I)